MRKGEASFSAYDNREDDHRVGSGRHSLPRCYSGCQALPVKHELIFLVRLFASLPLCCHSVAFSRSGALQGRRLLNFESARRRTAGKSHFPRTLTPEKSVPPDGRRKGRKIYYALSSAGGTCVPSLHSARRTRQRNLTGAART